MNLRKRALVGSPSTEATDREIENRKLVREAAAESFVLLKNENNLLPLEKGTMPLWFTRATAGTLDDHSTFVSAPAG